jgi:hypothetical protein
MFKGSNFEQLKDAIWKRCNLTVHCTTKFSLYELIYKFSPFDPIKRHLEKTTTIANDNTKSSILKEQIKTNSKRKVHEFKEGDQVYKKNQCPDKLEDKWLGPFIVTKVFNANNIEIQELRKKLFRMLKI